MLRRPTVLAIAFALMLSPLALADEGRSSELRTEAKRLMLEARELKEAGKLDRAEEVARRAKELLAEADEVSDVEKKPKPLKEEKEPKEDKAPKKAKPEKGDPGEKQPAKQPAKQPEKHQEKHPAKHPEKHFDQPELRKPVRVEVRPIDRSLDEPGRRMIILHHPKQGGPQMVEEKIMHMAAAVKHLREAGINDVADELERHIGMMKERLQKQHQPGGPGELAEVIQDLRQEVAELRRAVREMRAEMDRR